jgi:hypothetical protein
VAVAIVVTAVLVRSPKVAADVTTDHKTSELVEH